ncbi:MAG: glycoside hydrolase family 3 C-terminal domain-containing protein, partial [Bifidobacteriaceae bacterium]|nr:glycoside hydrolase family 3 C-terminal domain-containing protein [Bifidobacteriaceae bacterium]
MFESQHESGTGGVHRRSRRFTSLIALSLGTALAAAGLSVPADVGGTPAHAADALLPYQDATLPPSVRAADLVSRMTLSEKNLQLRATSQDKNATGNSAPAIARLGVKVYNYWNEGMHGVARAGNTPPQNWGGIAANNPGIATEFPTAIGMASTWDPDIIYQEGEIIGDEARAYYNHSGKGLTYWSPTINLSRDPRWGRAEESYGEDPVLTAAIGGQFVEGLQGDHPTYVKAVATPKHYLANNVDESRSSQNSVLTERALREYYTPAFAELAGPKYGARSLMSGYHAVNGVPLPAHYYALETLLRRTWGFDGFTTSDCSAIQGVYGAGHNWRPETLGGARITRVQAMAWSLKAGTDVDCEGGTYASTTQGVLAAVNQGFMTESDIDIALTRAFKIRMELGEFDNQANVPWSGSAYSLANQISNPDHLAVAAKMSDEAPVLLKNEATDPEGPPILPLGEDDARNLVVVGEFGPRLVHGDYSPTATTNQTTQLEGIEAAAADLVGPDASVTYITGQSTTSGTMPILGSVRFLDASDAVLSEVMPSTFFANSSGWANLRTVQGNTWPREVLSNPSNMAGQVFLDDVAIPAGTVKIAIGTGGIPTTTMPGGHFSVRLDSADGPPVTLPILAEGAGPAEFAANSNGRIPTYRSEAITYTLPNGDTLPGTTQDLYLQYSYEYNLSDADKAAIQQADAVIAVIGTLESDSRENNDRPNIDFPRGQAEMVSGVVDLNPRTVVWIQSVSDMNIEPFNAQVPAIVWSSYNGEFQGNATGRLLFGQANPSGKLPITFYSDIEQLGPKTDYTLTPTGGRFGRTYQYFTGDVTYPFGHGLSYSSFEYSNLRLSRETATPNDTITATVNVRNASSVPGKEVVQLYAVSPLAADPMYPDQQLKGFKKVAIGAGQTVSVSIPIDVRDLWFWNEAGARRTYATGQWTFRVGGSSQGGLSANWTMNGSLTPGIDQVVALPDGVVLNTGVPNNVIHANLSATRTDQSFYDLRNVRVVYTSSDTSVATVNSAGVVKPVGAGYAQITATVTADGMSKSTDFPVVVHAGELTTDYQGTDTTLFAQQVSFADQRVALSDASDGVMLNALALPQDPAATYRFVISPMDENTARATVTTGGELTAASAGRVKVHVVSGVGGTNYVRSAMITVQTAPVAQTAALTQEIEAALAQDYSSGEFTVSTWTAYETALTTAQGVLSDPAATAARVTSATSALATAQANLAVRANLSGVNDAMALVQALLPAKDDYTHASWVMLNTAYVAAQAAMATPDDTSQPRADAVAINLRAAATNLELDPNRLAPTSLAQLTDALTRAGLVAADFTASSWSAYRAALSRANSVLAQNPVNRADASAALTSLDNAYRGLIRRVSTADLAVKVAAAEALPITDYTSASAAAFNLALAAASAVVTGNPDAVTQREIDAVTAGLQAAIAGLVLDPNRNAAESLGQLVDALTRADPVGADFTTASWAVYRAALTHANTVLSQSPVSRADAAATAIALDGAYRGLVRRVSTVDLAAKVAAAEA